MHALIIITFDLLTLPFSLTIQRRPPERGKKERAGRRRLSEKNRRRSCWTRDGTSSSVRIRASTL
jgi:hypothetical protein